MRRQPPAPTKPMPLTDASFPHSVLRATEPVLVDFHADWCGVCHRLLPVLDELAVVYAGRIRVAKLDIDAHPATPRRYAVRGIPTLVLFHHGQEVWRLVKVVRKPAIAAKLDEALAGAAT